MRRTSQMLMFILLVVLSSSSAHTQSWSQLVTSSNPPARAHHSTVYDPLGNRIIIFGGSVSGGNVNDIWSLNLDSLAWKEITPLGSKPSARFTHNAIFDTARNQMVIWAGQGAPGVFYNDVWAFNFSTQTWEELWTQGDTTGAPVPRYGTTAQFDPVARRLINVSGISTAGIRYPDTWAFHIDSLQWSNQSTFPHPLERCLHTSDFAENRRRLFLYGGQRGGTPYLEDLWSLNVDTFEWEQLTPDKRPYGRHFSSMVYDGSGNLYVFGGKTSDIMATQDGAKNDLWRFSFDTNTWEQLLPLDPPAIRYGHTAIFARSRKSMIIVGGIVGNLRFNDVWEFQLATATHVPLSDIPTEFSLSQNYPNPFNPTTNIEFRIASIGFVSLKIYDMLGRNIATLVSESLHPGVYRRTWDGSGYPSGLYYYRLQTSNFLDTKTMTLLK